MCGKSNLPKTREKLSEIQLNCYFLSKQEEFRSISLDDCSVSVRDVYSLIGIFAIFFSSLFDRSEEIESVD